MAVGGGTGASAVVGQLVNCLGLGGTERQLVEHLRRLDRTRFSPRLYCLQKKGEFLGTMRDMGLDPPEFHLRGTLMRPNTAVQIARLAKALRESEAALLHSHDFYSNLVGSAAAGLARIPFIVSRRDIGVWISPSQTKVLSMVTRLAPYVLCNAAAVRDHIVRYEGVDPDRVHVIHNGIDLDRFDEAASMPAQPPLPILDGNGPVVVLVANLKHPVKGHGEFLLAAAAVARVHPECRFMLVGDGELRSEFERRARDLGLGQRLYFAGRRTDVPALLSRCTIAVSASHAEGLSNSIMEAMAARLPVVATAVGGNIELVDDGRTGHLVRPRDPSHLAARLIDLLRAPHFARRLGLAGRKRIERDFSAQRLGERMQQLYERVLGRTGAARRAA